MENVNQRRSVLVKGRKDKKKKICLKKSKKKNSNSTYKTENLTN